MFFSKISNFAVVFDSGQDNDVGNQKGATIFVYWSFYWSIWICSTCFGRQTRPPSGALLTVYTALLQCTDFAADRWQGWDGQDLCPTNVYSCRIWAKTLKRRRLCAPIPHTHTHTHAHPHSCCNRRRKFQSIISFPRVKWTLDDISALDQQKSTVIKTRRNACFISVFTNLVCLTMLCLEEMFKNAVIKYSLNIITHALY
jgi:hypothetical protein